MRSLPALPAALSTGSDAHAPHHAESDHMPELNFVLPHWLYWGGLIGFPLVTYWIYHARREEAGGTARASLPLAYFLLLVGGFMGVHRLYLKSRWAIAFILVFVAILFVNVEVRDVRNQISDAHNQVRLAQLRIDRAEKAIARGRNNAEQKMEQARAAMEDAKEGQAGADEKGERIEILSMALGALSVLLILIDALLLPGLVRKANEEGESGPAPGFECPLVEAEHDDGKEPFLFNRMVSHINGVVGELVAYWSVLAVFVYYYEVIARYVFNSPTNWAHEAMFLMFGMQYLLAGGFVLREGAHVRVDVLYMHLPKRGKALLDILTSVFFFIFTLTLIWTGWTFFMDSYEVNEVSFTEWAVQYWPIKFALPLGGALLLLQGIAQLVKDIAVLIDPGVAELDTEVRPEG
ncbi:MAG TPA: TRAP transporter small permease subunit [Sedimenticola thiotaurini]|uniref:TRAP transporter small permease protein n=1 Tax=Sedimenticola thiotaurini TaxID=1543721 RepID=A0A831RMP4_9GAMM|nr:TRAP transporter small permease subunit [Sedimenticola thiotaurini]